MERPRDWPFMWSVQHLEGPFKGVAQYYINLFEAVLQLNYLRRKDIAAVKRKPMIERG